MNWFALLCLDHKRSDDSGFYKLSVILWLYLLLCKKENKSLLTRFFYINFKSIDISKKVLVTVGCVIKTVSVTFLLFQMLFIIAWRVLPLLPTLVVGSCMVLILLHFASLFLQHCIVLHLLFLYSTDQLFVSFSYCFRL